MQSFKLRFLQNSPLLQLYTSANDYKGVGDIPGSLFVKPFQLFRYILDDVSSVTKAPSLQCCFQSREQVTISYSQVRRVRGDAAALSLCSLLRSHRIKPTGV